MDEEEMIEKLNKAEQDIKSRNLEIDDILNIAKQSNDQISNIANDINNKLNNIISVESQINQKNQLTEQFSATIKQNEEQAINKLQIIEQIRLDVEKKEFEAEELKSKISDLFEKINDHFKGEGEKYDIFYKQIEEELKAGVTSVNLSKSFADKVREYRLSSRIWAGCFIVLLVSLVGYYGYTTFSTNEIKTTQDVWRHLTFRAPFLIFSVWLAIFFGNRRAESKKLEELYKHKEVMARSFIGYKKTLEELGDEDKMLLKEHMKNLLGAMNENSAIFLNTEGDKHPVFETLNSILRPKKNTAKEE